MNEMLVSRNWLRKKIASDPEIDHDVGPVMNMVTVIADNGDVYEATKSNGAAWEVSFPEGGDRFYGTEAEVRSHIRRLIKHGSAAKVVS